MSTNRDFNNLINEYLPVSLMKEELIKRDYLLSKVDRDDSWTSGNIVIPKF